MKKTLIALAVGAAFVAPAAYADVTISGSINMGLAIAKSGDSTDTIAATGSTIIPSTTRTEGITKTGVTTTYSNITIGSMEDLGGGLKLDFAAQMDWGGLNTAGAGISNRNSHIGLVSESWGGVWYGTNENIYERYFYSVDPIDGAMGIGGNLTILGNPGIAALDCPAGSGGRVFSVGNDCGAGFYRRTDHTVWYDSPNWNGFTFGVFTTLTALKTQTSNPRLWGAGVKYVGPSIPLQLWAAYESHKDVSLANLQAINTTTSSTSDRGIQVGAGYTLGDIFIFANYEQLKYQADGLTVGDLKEYKRNAWSIGGKWNLATGYLGAQYIQAQDGKCELEGVGGCNADKSGARLISVGYFHTMSKQTQVYLVGAFLNNDDFAQYANPDALGSPNDNVGVATTSVTVGIKHSF
jgi:predicted porin